VRDAITEITAYATTLMAFCIASEETATRKNGVMVPNERFVTAGRLHSVVHLPRILQLLREISGQGLISRFTQAAFERADIGALLDEFLPGTGTSARAKNRLFNFVWDLTCSSHAMRVALFENVNATPAAAMRNRIYESAYRTGWTESVREFLGIELES
jgi:aromatic ring hydroxylase